MVNKNKGYQRFPYCEISGKQITNPFKIRKECLINYKGKDGNAGKCLYCVHKKFTRWCKHFHKRKLKDKKV